MAIFASKVAAGQRQTRDSKCEEPTEIMLLGERSAAAAMGAKHTEEHLLRANREIRSQLERALQKAEAHRVDELRAITRADQGEKDKADLEARLACLSGELKLQAAPLTAMQLELAQARLDTETMRERLKNHRKESRLRIDDCERVSFESQQRMQRVDDDLAGIVKACQQETQRASKYERMFQDSSAAGKRLIEDLEKAKADARKTAQEITSLRAKLDEKERTKTEEVNSYRDKAARSEELIAQLRQDLAKSDNLANELSQLHGGQTEEHARCLEAMKERAHSLTKENTRLRSLAEANEEAHREQEGNRAGQERRQGSRANLSPQHLQSARDRLSRTVDDLCHAEEATELVLTCLLCTRLFRDPQVMTPCGHTLCADCCGGGGSGSGSQGTPTSEGAEGVLAKQTEGLEMLPSDGCRLCEKEKEAAGEASVGGEHGVAPNRTVSALVAKHTFRRQLFQVLKRTSAVLSQDGPCILP
eukprot:jgi/Undpi1/5541/HiC_scaffold_2.g00818.m1